MKSKESKHYIFNYHENSLAEKDIEQIIERQEYCYDFICQTLKVPQDFIIHYFLCNTPEEVGMFYGDNDSCNGFNRMPDKIYAVYTNDLQCLGFHEDAHLISYHYITRPDCNFIREGLAMFFDRTWHSISNFVWTKTYLKKRAIPKFETLIENEVFFQYDCNFTYPVSGAFTEYLIIKFGIDRYKSLYLGFDSLRLGIFKKCFGYSLNELEEDFYKYISLLEYEELDRSC